MLEGEVYILTIERGGKREIASWTVLFPPGRALLGTQVFFGTLVDSFQSNQTTLCSEAQRALGFNEYLKKIKSEIQDWLTNTVCVSIVL